MLFQDPPLKLMMIMEKMKTKISFWGALTIPSWNKLLLVDVLMSIFTLSIVRLGNNYQE